MDALFVSFFLMLNHDLSSIEASEACNLDFFFLIKSSFSNCIFYLVGLSLCNNLIFFYILNLLGAENLAKKKQTGMKQMLFYSTVFSDLFPFLSLSPFLKGYFNYITKKT